MAFNLASVTDLVRLHAPAIKNAAQQGVAVSVVTLGGVVDITPIERKSTTFSHLPEGTAIETRAGRVCVLVTRFDAAEGWSRTAVVSVGLDAKTV